MTTNTTNDNTKAIETNIDIENRRVEFKFSNGRELTILMSELSEEIRTMACLHGLKQKLGDAAAISRNTTTGASASIDDKFEAVSEVYGRLVNEGEWNKKREGGSPKYGLLLTALTRLYPAKSVDDLKTFIDKKDKSELNALRANPKISAIIDGIKRERLGDIDTDSLLDELESKTGKKKGGK